MVFEKVRDIIVDQLDADEADVTMEASIIDDLVNSSINLTWMCRIKQKKRNIGIYDYAHIALWYSKRTTVYQSCMQK